MTRGSALAAVVETVDLTKRFRDHLAVDRVTLGIGQGESWAILGPNGSGKTTLLGMLLGVIRPTSGRIQLFGEYDGVRDHRARLRIGATLETPNYYPYLSGYDNLQITSTIKRVPKSAISRALETVGLSNRARDPVKAYSLGMKQRLVIAGALLSQPELVILDEPLNGLDPEGMYEMREVLRRVHAEGRALLIASHLIHEVERTCTHVALIRAGRVLYSGTIDELIPIGSAVFVRALDSENLLQRAAGYPACTTVRAEGDGAVIGIADGDIASLNRWLVAQGLDVIQLEPRRPTLEEVYISLTGAREQAPVAVG